MERGSVWRPNVDMSPSCPRCGSSNTKFCYYNNYSLTQPRYFCKGCRRYWTKGGSLRNVPVGGGCRKSRRPKSSHHNVHNGKNLTNRYNNGVDSSGSGGGGGPNIDLALVYANFLNPKPDNSKKDQLPNGSDQNPVEFVVSSHKTSSLAVDPSSGELLLQVENPNCSPLGSTWSSEIVDHHYHNHHHHQMLLDGFEEINDKNQERVQEYCNYGLPPLPGEELVCVSHQGIISSNFVLSEPPLIDNHIIAPAPVVQAPVVHYGGESDDPSNLLFGGWSPLDFSTIG